MTRQHASKQDDKWKEIRRNRPVETVKWVPPTHDRWCRCEIDSNGKSCVAGCELKQQRRECKGCLNGNACANNVIQRAPASFRGCEKIDC
eukprot:1377229-Rhodomonas_salina.2